VTNENESAQLHVDVNFLRIIGAVSLGQCTFVLTWWVTEWYLYNL